jgi:hypothetical protein
VPSVLPAPQVHQEDAGGDTSDRSGTEEKADEVAPKLNEGVLLNVPFWHAPITTPPPLMSSVQTPGAGDPDKVEPPLSCPVTHAGGELGRGLPTVNGLSAATKSGAPDGELVLGMRLTEIHPIEKLEAPAHGETSLDGMPNAHDGAARGDLGHSVTEHDEPDADSDTHQEFESVLDTATPNAVTDQMVHNSRDGLPTALRTDVPRALDLPSSAPAEPATAIRQAPEPAADFELRSSTPGDISLRIGPDRGGVSLRVGDRGGEVHVAIHSPDPELGASMRRHLDDLSRGLEAVGYRSDPWIPGSDSHRDSRRAEASGITHETSGHLADNGSDPNENRHASRHATEWLEELENRRMFGSRSKSGGDSWQRQ